jgi:hypothetical protein
MKKVVLSNAQIDQIINLHQKGVSWVKIQDETGIPRRIASREYDSWLAKQSQRQLEEARKDVAAEEYRLHLNLLSRMAEFLLDALVIPNPLTDLRPADKVISQFLKIDFYQDHPEIVIRSMERQKGKRVFQMNEILFKSLRDHTKIKIQWQDLDEWKDARKSCLEDIENMKKEVDKVFTGILNKKSELKVKLDKGDLPSYIENIKKGILTNIWLSGVIGPESQITSMKGVSQARKGTAWVVFHKNTPEEINVMFDRETPHENELLAKKVVEASIQTVKFLLSSQNDLIVKMKREIQKMHNSSDKLEAVLNPLVLRPIILNSQCDICPI